MEIWGHEVLSLDKLCMPSSIDVAAHDDTNIEQTPTLTTAERQLAINSGIVGIEIKFKILQLYKFMIDGVLAHCIDYDASDISHINSLKIALADGLAVLISPFVYPANDDFNFDISEAIRARLKPICSNNICTHLNFSDIYLNRINTAILSAHLDDVKYKLANYPYQAKQILFMQHFNMPWMEQKFSPRFKSKLRARDCGPFANNTLDIYNECFDVLVALSKELADLNEINFEPNPLDSASSSSDTILFPESEVCSPSRLRSTSSSSISERLKGFLISSGSRSRISRAASNSFVSAYASSEPSLTTRLEPISDAAEGSNTSASSSASATQSTAKQDTKTKATRARTMSFGAKKRTA